MIWQWKVPAGCLAWKQSKIARSAGDRDISSLTLPLTVLRMLTGPLRRGLPFADNRQLIELAIKRPALSSSLYLLYDCCSDLVPITEVAIFLWLPPFIPSQMT